MNNLDKELQQKQDALRKDNVFPEVYKTVVKHIKTPESDADGKPVFRRCEKEAK